MHGNAEALVFVVGCAVLLGFCVLTAFTGYPVLGASLGTVFGSLGVFTLLDLRRGGEQDWGDEIGGGDQPPLPPRGRRRGGNSGGGGTPVPARPKRRPPSDRVAAAVRRQR